MRGASDEDHQPGKVSPAAQTISERHAVEMVSKSGTDSGVAMLLDMPADQAARILARCPRGVAGELIQGIAVARPETAGTILRMSTASRAGLIFDDLSTGVAASILAAVPLGEAVRILTECNVRTAAEALSKLPHTASGRLLTAMPDERAAEVLVYMKPSIAAAMLQAVPEELSRRLLQRLRPAFRELIARDM